MKITLPDGTIVMIGERREVPLWTSRRVWYYWPWVIFAWPFRWLRRKLSALVGEPRR